MKKTLYTISFILIMFIGVNTVNASDATCVYAYSTVKVKCELTKDETPKCTATSSSGNVTIGDTFNLSTSDFQDTTNNKWNCPSEIYASYASNSSGMHYGSPTSTKPKGTYVASFGLSKEESSFNNLISEEKESITYCKYGDFILSLNNTTKKVSGSNALCSKVSVSINYDDLSKISVDNKGCPTKLYALRSSVPTQGIVCDYLLKSSIGYSSIKLVTDEKITDGTGTVIEDTEENTSPVDKTEGATIALIQEIYRIIKIVIPVLIVILSIVDFLKVVLLSDEKDFQGAKSKLMKRIVIGIIFFIVPAIVTLIINLSGIEAEQNFLKIFT